MSARREKSEKINSTRVTFATNVYYCRKSLGKKQNEGNNEQPSLDADDGRGIAHAETPRRGARARRLQSGVSRRVRLSDLTKKRTIKRPSPGCFHCPTSSFLADLPSTRPPEKGTFCALHNQFDF